MKSSNIRPNQSQKHLHGSIKHSGSQRRRWQCHSDGINPSVPVYGARGSDPGTDDRSGGTRHLDESLLLRVRGRRAAESPRLSHANYCVGRNDNKIDTLR